MNKIQIMEDERNEFQDTIWRDMEARKRITYYDIGELIDYPIFPKVFNPIVAKASLFFLENLGVEKGDCVIDVFSGSGIYGVKAVIDGALHVISIDNFLPAYNNIKYVIKKYNLERKMEAHYGDLFEPIKHDIIGNLILANPPFRADKKPRTISERALRDEDYFTLERFWRSISEEVMIPSENFRVRMVFSDVGDMNYNEQLMKNNGFKFDIVARSKYASSIRIHVYEAKLK